MFKMCQYLAKYNYYCCVVLAQQPYSMAETGVNDWLRGYPVTTKAIIKIMLRSVGQLRD